MRRRSGPSPARLLAGGFAAAAALGALLLALPPCNADGAWHLDSGRLFVSVSAVCVTGLDPIGVADGLSAAGLAVLVVLAQFGALGIMTAGTFLFAVLGRALSVAEERSVVSSLGEVSPHDMRRALYGTFAFTFLWEAAGAAFFAFRLHAALPGYESAWRSAGHGAFLSVMSFCNAGFSPVPGSFAQFAQDPATTLASACLAMAGGVGFLANANLLRLRPWRRNRAARGRLALHSRLAFDGLLLFFVADFVVFALLEWCNAFAAPGAPARSFATTAFHCFSVRASGFAAVPAETLSPASQLYSAVRMFVGAAPGSTGGGVKTTTVFVLVAAVAAMFARREVPELHGRSLPRRAVNDALAVFAFGLAAALATAFAVMAIERPAGGGAFPLLFEAVSAYSNNGLSLGSTTASLSVASRLVLCAAMFAGRLGPATLAWTLAGDGSLADRSKRYPEENVVIG